MAKKLLLPFLLAMILIGCQKQEDIIITPSNNPFEVMPERFQQNILLEHFSDEAQSVTVENSLFVDQLKSKYPSRLIVANFHQNDFLATSYSSFLGTSLGGLLSISKGAINRNIGKQTLAQEDGQVLLSPQNWEGAILQALQKPDAPLSISLETGTEANDVGFVKVYIAHKTSISPTAKLVVYLLEDNIQPIFQNGNQIGFSHQNVFKNLLTEYEGDSVDLTGSSEKGLIHKSTFTNINLNNYNVANLKVIAFVYENHPDFKQKQILNSQEANFYGVHYWDID